MHSAGRSSKAVKDTARELPYTLPSLHLLQLYPLRHIQHQTNLRKLIYGRNVLESIYIHGGIALQGQVRVQGSKNAVLPVMAATLLTEGISTIGNCPKLKDVYHMQTLLESLGCTTAISAS